MDIVSVPGPAGKIVVEDSGGNGAPVLFTHSLAGNAAQWAPQAAHLRGARRTIAIELRGHGRSAPPAGGDYTIGAMAGDVGAVADALGLERFALVGHSLGGSVALEYAGAHSDRVTALALIDSNGDAREIPRAEVDGFFAALESNYAETIDRFWSNIAGTDAAVRQRLMDDLRATPRETVLHAMRDVFRYDPNPALAAWRGPTICVVTPNNDQPFSLHRLGAGLPYRVIAGTGHWIQLERPDAVNAVLDELLATPSGAR